MTRTAEEAQQLARQVVEHVQQFPEGSLSGSRVGQFIRVIQPDFDPTDFDVPTMRAFLETYAAPLSIIGHSGLDPIWGIRSENPTSPGQGVSNSLDDAAAWRTWVSPGAPFAIAVERQTGRIRSIYRGEAVQEGEAAISSASPEVHREIAREFVSTTSEIPDSLADELRRSVEDAGDSWWKLWANALRPHTAILGQWMQYRKTELERRLRNALAAAGLEPDLVERAARDIAASRGIMPPPRRDDAKSVRPVLGGGALVVAPRRRAHVPALVQAVVARMHEFELRALSLPVGLVLDVLNDEASQGR